MKRALQDLVRKRALNRCEYCRIATPPFHIEHIVARKHGGASHAENLALACVRCNFYKGPNLSGFDPESGAMSRLFNPRLDKWDEHFRWQGALLVGLTSVGRATIAVLEINHIVRVELRQRLILEGLLKPP
jgi:HNH endonuclease